MRHYSVERRPLVIEITGGKAPSAWMEIEESLERDPGFKVRVELEGDSLILPPPHEVRFEGRVLRSEEYKRYAQSCLAAASKLGARAILFRIEEIYTLDWDAFSRRNWEALQSAYESLPGWLGAEGLPRWFGQDERKGPCLWASVEPPGLQVGGILEPERFDDWHQRFLEMTVELPTRPV